jgi:hypothetical protein
MPLVNGEVAQGRQIEPVARLWHWPEGRADSLTLTLTRPLAHYAGLVAEEISESSAGRHSFRYL